MTIGGRDVARDPVVASAPTLKPPKDPDVLAVEGDIADPASAGRVIGGALEWFCRLDTLVVYGQPLAPELADQSVDIVLAALRAGNLRAGKKHA